MENPFSQLCKTAHCDKGSSSRWFAMSRARRFEKMQLRCLSRWKNIPRYSSIWAQCQICSGDPAGVDYNGGGGSNSNSGPESSPTCYAEGLPCVFPFVMVIQGVGYEHTQVPIVMMMLMAKMVMMAMVVMMVMMVMMVMLEMTMTTMPHPGLHTYWWGPWCLVRYFGESCIRKSKWLFLFLKPLSWNLW